MPYTNLYNENSFYDKKEVLSIRYETLIHQGHYS